MTVTEIAFWQESGEEYPNRRVLIRFKRQNQKSNEDPSELLERIFEAYERCADVDVEALGKPKVVNIPCTGHSIPDKRNHKRCSRHAHVTVG